MDRKENYEEESTYTEEGEITLGGVGRFIKRAWLRTLIYLVVAMTLATIVFTAFRFIGPTEYSMSTTVEFTFSGISTGETPDGSTFNKDDIRSIDNVRNAITEAGLTEKILNNGDITSARNHITVTAVMPDEYIQKYNELVSGGMNSADAYTQLATMTFYPTSFVISLRNYREVGLDNTDAKKLVDALVDNYRKVFAEEYLSAIIFSDTAFNVSEDAQELAELDYMDYIENFELSYNNISTYLTRMTANASSFVSSSGKSFAAFNEELSFLNTQLSSAKAFITNANVSNNLENMKVSTQNQIDTLTRQSENLGQLISDTSTQIDNIKPTQTTIVSSSGQTSTVTSYPDIYNKLMEQLQNYRVQKSSIDLSLEEKKYLYGKIESATNVAEKDMKEADRRLNSIRTAAKSFIAEVNTASRENAERSAGADSFAVVSPTSETGVYRSFPTIPVYLGAALIAIVVGVIVTYVFGKRYRARIAAQEKAARAVEKDAPEQKNEQ